MTMLSAYHAKYLAYDLTRRCPSDSFEKLERHSLFDAQHQVDRQRNGLIAAIRRGAGTIGQQFELVIDQMADDLRI